MIANTTSPELLEDELKAIAQAGDYRSEEEVVRHALQVLLAANSHLRVDTAVELYRQGKVTLARAAEIAQLEWETFKERLDTKGVPLRVDELPEDVRSGAALIHRSRETI